MDGAPLDAVTAMFARIDRQIAPAEPLLIYLRPGNLEQALGRVHHERGASWAAQNIAYVSNCPWARSRALGGRDAIIELYRAWERLVDALLGTTSCATLLLVDPQDNWEAALARIYSAVVA